MLRLDSEHNLFRTRFHARIKKNKNCLVWKEQYKNESGTFLINSQYKLLEKKDIPGIAVEEYGDKIIYSFCILSFRDIPHTSVRKIFYQNNYLIHYLDSFNINLDKITRESNRILV